MYGLLKAEQKEETTAGGEVISWTLEQENYD
jgi:hypothetical protein